MRFLTFPAAVCTLLKDGRRGYRYIFRKAVCLLLLTLLGFDAAFLSACGKKAPESISDTGFYFDTVITVTLYDPARNDALEGCFSLAEKYESYFSATLPDSDVAQINAHPFEPVAVHEETVELIEKGIAYGKMSGGKFDITVGKLTEVWNFSEAAGSEAGFSLPSDELVQTLAAGVDYRAIAVDRANGTVTLNSDACAIDLGGIAKGYIADRMKEYLVSEGISAGLINLGGNVLALGKKPDPAQPDGSLYTIGIQKPFSENGEAILKLSVADSSVVTSGTYQRYAEIDGKLYHHIIDSSTGYPYDNGLSSVTVLSESSADGDALSTTLFAMGLTDGLARAEELDAVEAIFITTDNELYYTSGFQDGKISYSEL